MPECFPSKNGTFRVFAVYSEGILPRPRQGPRRAVRPRHRTPTVAVVRERRCCVGASDWRVRLPYAELYTARS
eukprot:gene1585-biopygen4279